MSSCEDKPQPVVANVNAIGQTATGCGSIAPKHQCSGKCKPKCGAQGGGRESRLADIIRDLNASRNDAYFVQCREFRDAQMKAKLSEDAFERSENPQCAQAGARRTHKFARSARRAFQMKPKDKLNY